MLIAVAVVAASLAGPHRSGVKWVPLKPGPAPYEKAHPADPPSEREDAPSTMAPPSTSAPAVAPPQIVQSAMAPTAPHQLNLTCLGAGTANKLKAATVFGGTNYSGTVGFTPYGGSSSGSATILGTQDRPFADQVDVRLFGGDDRIRIPRTMLPPIHGGNAGWFKLKDVTADARSIRGKAAVGLLNNPNVFIDRMTGTISISGKAGDYAGQCQAIAADTPVKF
jgi:hypothetical protein